jgi:hypothetical protein
MVNNGNQQIAEELVNTAISRGSMDNVTCIVVRLSGYVTRMINKEASSKMDNEFYRGDFMQSTSSPSILTGMGNVEMNMEGNYKTKLDLNRSYDESKLKDALSNSKTVGSYGSTGSNLSNLGSNIINNNSGMSNNIGTNNSTFSSISNTGYGTNLGNMNAQRSRNLTLNKFGADDSKATIGSSRYSALSQDSGQRDGRESPIAGPPLHSPIQTTFKRPMTVAVPSRNLNPLALSKQSGFEQAGDISAMYGSSNASNLFKSNSFQPINSGYTTNNGQGNLFGTSNATGFLKKIGAMREN